MKKNSSAEQKVSSGEPKRYRHKVGEPLPEGWPMQLYEQDDEEARAAVANRAGITVEQVDLVLLAFDDIPSLRVGRLIYRAKARANERATRTSSTTNNVPKNQEK